MKTSLLTDPYNISSLSKFEVKSFSPEGIFSGYASLFNVPDLAGDKIIPGAFQHHLKKWAQEQRLPALLWQHKLDEPIGKWLSIQEDDKGLWVEGQIVLDLPKGRDAYTLIKQGITTGLSIGFTPIITRKENGHRLIYQANLWEISIVSLACQPRAFIENIKNYF